jgi:hypothetical protein
MYHYVTPVKGKRRTSKASWTATTFEDSRIKMGGNQN